MKLFGRNLENLFIPAGTIITEFKFGDGNRSAVSAKLGMDVTLDPSKFAYVEPKWEDRITGHVCFQYTDGGGHISHIYVPASAITERPQTWVDRNKQNVI